MSTSYNSSIVTDGLVFSVDPANLKSYDSRENLFTYSEQIDNAAWTKQFGTITADATIAPDGTSTADRFVEDTNNGEHSIYRTYVASNVTRTFSLYLKAGERTGVALTFSNFLNADARGYFNLLTGVATPSGNNADFTNISASMVSVGNGWWRCSLTATKAAVNTAMNPSIMSWNGSTTSFASNTTTGFYAWGAQVENGSVASPYIQTVASAVTRSTTITDNVSKLTGTLYNVPPLVSTNSNISLSYTAASSQYIAVPYSSILAPTSAVTVAAWGWRSAWSNSLDGRLVAKTETGGWHLGVGTTTFPSAINFTVYVNGAYVDVTYAMSNLAAGWHYIVGVCDGSIARLFVDGVQVSTGTPASPGLLGYTNNNNMIIGAESGGGSPNSVAAGYFTGYIGPVQVYNTALTVNQVRQNFNAHRGRYGI